MLGPLLDSVNTMMYLSFGVAALVVFFAAIAVIRLLRSGAQNRQLLNSGTPATAVILELRDTGVTVNDNPQVELLLDVRPSDGSPFQATARTLISRLQTSQIQPGMQVLVRFDAHNPSRVALAGFISGAR